MELEISPEPSSDEREALLRGLTERERPQPPNWWEAGLREAIDPEGEER